MPTSHRPLVVGIDARAATEEIAGRGRVVRELLRALQARGEPHRYLLYAREAWEQRLDERFSWRLNRRKDPWWHVATARSASRACDVFLSSNSYLTAWLATVPTIPIVYDLVTFDRAMRPRRASVLIERLTLGLAVRRSAALIAISRATADDLERRFPRAAGRVTIAPLAVSPSLTSTASAAATSAASDDHDLDLPARFVLAVGTLEPRKNLPRLIEAFESLPLLTQAENPLVVVGRIGWEAAETLDALDRLGQRCRLLGRISDARLAALYERCTVLCYPSLGEGFGLPVLEAMQAGAPVITSDRSSMPEVGGDAVEYVDPTDVASIAGALARLLEDPDRRAQLAAAGRERAKGFTWERTAEQVLHALERVARAP